MVELVDHVRLRRADAAGEGEELRRVDVLGAQRQQVVRVERLARARAKSASASGSGQVDAFGFDAEPGEGTKSDHFRNSGEISLGRNRMISGKTIVKASTPSIGMSMIITSFITYISRTLAMAQEIIRHRP